MLLYVVDVSVGVDCVWHANLMPWHRLLDDCHRLIAHLAVTLGIAGHLDCLWNNGRWSSFSAAAEVAPYTDTDAEEDNDDGHDDDNSQKDVTRFLNETACSENSRSDVFRQLTVIVGARIAVRVVAGIAVAGIVVAGIAAAVAVAEIVRSIRHCQLLFKIIILQANSAYKALTNQN